MKITQKRIFSWLSFFLWATLLMAQINQKNQAIIYSYDGSILIGEVVEENDKHVQLKVFYTDTVSVPNDMIRKMYRSPEDVLIFDEGKIHYTSGYYFSSSTAFGGGESSSFDFDFIAGSRIDPTYSIGVGLAFNFNNIPLVPNEWIEAHFITLFAYGQYYFTNNKRRIFAATRLGYGFPSGFGFEIDHTGGLHFQPGIGIHFPSKRNRRFKLSLSHMVQKAKGTDTSFDVLNNPVSVSYDLWLSRTMLRFGWEFG